MSADAAAFSGDDGLSTSNTVAGLTLLEHGRYAHSASYVEQALRRAGLAPVTMRPGMLRFERGAPVQGLVIAAGRDRADALTYTRLPTEGCLV
jgi:predicted TPR repeat methyltransferase